MRDGAKVTKRYYAPATPHQRLFTDPRTAVATRERVAAVFATLDPVQLKAIQPGQQQLVEIADRPVCGETSAPTAPTLAEFLSAANRMEGEIRPTSRPRSRSSVVEAGRIRS